MRRAFPASLWCVPSRDRVATHSDWDWCSGRLSSLQMGFNYRQRLQFSYSLLKQELITAFLVFWSACKLLDAFVGLIWLAVCYWITTHTHHTYTHRLRYTFISFSVTAVEDRESRIVIFKNQLEPMERSLPLLEASSPGTARVNTLQYSVHVAN